jgi:uncharacterized protein
MYEPKQINRIANDRMAENQAFFKRLSRVDKRKLDDIVHFLHDEVFDKIDCLECANCCRTLGPRITNADVSRIAAQLKKKPAQLVTEYLRYDEEGDLVFKVMPCPFICVDNTCQIYADRPRACREYPHTDRRKFFQVLPITLKNSFTCPAVLEIIERLKRENW